MTGNGMSVADELAQKVFGKRYMDLTDEERRKLKSHSLWLPTMYGRGINTSFFGKVKLS